MAAFEHASTEIVSATEFKAKCLQLFKRLSGGDLSRVEVTKRGKVVAVVTPPPTASEGIWKLYGSMKGTVQMPEDFDLTAPILDEPWIVDDEDEAIEPAG